MELNLSKHAAEQLDAMRAEAMRRGPKTKEQERAAQDAERERARKRRDEQQEQYRSKLKADRNAATKSETTLRDALDELDARLEARDPKSKENARRKLDEAGTVVRKARDKVARLKRELEAAQVEQRRVEGRREVAYARWETLGAKADSSVTEARESLRQAWETNEAAWHALSTTYRKKTRDRVLKNRAKAALDITVTS